MNQNTSNCGNENDNHDKKYDLCHESSSISPDFTRTGSITQNAKKAVGM